MENGFLSEAVTKQFFRQVVMGIHHCHAMGVMHRDIKAENICFKDVLNTQIKIIDFGLGSKGLNVATGIVGTPFYMAPEIFTKK